MIGNGDARVGVVTDMGVATTLIRERLKTCDAVVVEANHDEDMLNDAERPWSLKQRIRGRQGHLSNRHAAEMMAEIAGPRLRRICLAHLSRDCNSLEAVDRTFSDLRASSTIPYSIATIAPDRPAMLTVDLA